MPPRLPRITSMETIRKLHRDGWYIDHTSGAHHQLRHASKPGTVTVSRHPGQIIHPKILRSIIRQASLTVAEFVDL